MSRPPLPPSPSVTLPPELAAVADYIAARHGLDRGVVVMVVLAALGAVTGGSRDLAWHGDKLPLTLQLLLAPAVVAETAGWLDFLARPLDDEVTKLREEAGQMQHLPDRFKNIMKHLRGMALDDPRRAETILQTKKLGELLGPCFFTRTLPATGDEDAHSSTLLLDPTGWVLRLLLEERGLVQLNRLAHGRRAGDTRDTALILTSPPDLVAALKYRDAGKNWCPPVLPQDAAPFAPTVLTMEEAAEKWKGAVDMALAIRRGTARTLTVSEAGEAALNRVKAAAEAAARTSQRPLWFGWSCRVCAQVAAILHIAAGTEGEIAPATWKEAGDMTSWLIGLQTRRVGTMRATVTGSPNVFPPRPDDPDRMRRLMAKRPDATFRYLSRYLTKRPAGHWRFVYDTIKEIQPVFADGIKIPTPESAAFKAEWQNCLSRGELPDRPDE